MVFINKSQSWFLFWDSYLQSKDERVSIKEKALQKPHNQPLPSGINSSHGNLRQQGLVINLQLGLLEPLQMEFILKCLEIFS